MATVYTDLIPRDVANEAIAAAEQESVCFTLGNVIRMSEGLESVPVVSVAPVVDFVTPTYGGRKPMTTIEWTSEQLQPVELAARLAVPDAFLNDAGLPVWTSVRTELAKAIATTLDQLVAHVELDVRSRRAREAEAKAAIVTGLAPYRAADGGYVLENEFRYLLARA